MIFTASFTVLFLGANDLKCREAMVMNDIKGVVKKCKLHFFYKIRGGGGGGMKF